MLGGVIIGAALSVLMNIHGWSGRAYLARLAFYGGAWAVFCGWLSS
jgi:hypothetical protein